MPFDPAAVAQIGAAGVLAAIVGLFVTGKIGPMSLVDRADARAEKAMENVGLLSRDIAQLIDAVHTLTTEVREARLRGRN